MNNTTKILGIGISIGVILTVILIVVMGVKPTSVEVGPVSFEIPTPITTHSESPSLPTSQDDTSSESSCPSLSMSQIEQIKTSQDVQTAIQQTENFTGYHQNDYQKGAQIPANVVIATNLYDDPAKFPLLPIKNEFGWGVFLTTDSFTAPNAGTYWCVVP